MKVIECLYALEFCLQKELFKSATFNIQNYFLLWQNPKLSWIFPNMLAFSDPFETMKSFNSSQVGEKIIEHFIQNQISLVIRLNTPSYNKNVVISSFLLLKE